MLNFLGVPIRNSEIRNFFYSIRKSQIRKIYGRASPLIANPQKIGTLGQRGSNTLFKKFSPFTALSWQNNLMFSRRFVRTHFFIQYKFQPISQYLEEKIYVFVDALSPQIKTGSANRKIDWACKLQIFAFIQYICGRSANLRTFRICDLRNLFLKNSVWSIYKYVVFFLFRSY